MMQAFHIIVALKPLQGTFVSNVIQHGVAGLNIKACRIGTDDTRQVKRGGANDFPHEDDAWIPKTIIVGSACGRFPANVVLDGSEEVVGEFPETVSGKPCGVRHGTFLRGRVGEMQNSPSDTPLTGFGDSGSAARFFKQFEEDAE